MVVTSVIPRTHARPPHAAHVLVAAVGAGADEAILDFEGPASLFGNFSQFGDGGAEVGGEGAVHGLAQGGQVDL